jgi:hypothetical protein
MSETKPKKMVRRSAAIALGIICILLVAGLGVAITYYTITINNKDTTINNDDATINQLNATIKDQINTIASLKATITTLTNEYNQLETWLDGNITSYETQISSLNGQISSLNSQINQLQNSENSLQTTYNDYVSDHNYTNEQYQSLSNQITSLNSIIASENATITSLLQSMAYPLPPASTYFAISGQAAIFLPIGSITNASDLPVGGTILIQQLAFNFTPIVGPATNIRIFIQGESQLWWAMTIPQGNTAFTGILVPTTPIPSTRQSDGNFTFSITLLCDQASGTIIIQFTPDELFVLN